MDITKLRLLKQKNGNGLELSYEKPGASGDKVGVPSETHTAIVHNDLYNAVQALAPHLAIMAFHVKEVEDIAMPDANVFKDFTVGSYNISGKEEKRGIIISGTLRKHGKAHNFNTPFYRFEEPPSAKYGYMEDLEAKLRVIESEVPQYLDGTKRGEPAQPELGMPDGKKEKVTKLQIAAPDPNVKVTEEGNKVPESSKHKFANKDAMERVAEMDGDGKKKASGKRVKQSAEHPSGIVPEEKQEESPI
jgi:hypothetical protein